MPLASSAAGLRASGSSPNHTPAFLAFHFLFAYGALQSRCLKMYHGLDHQVSPRYDLRDYGEEAVRSGKITKRQLKMLERCESAGANAIENYTLLVAALCLANMSGVELKRINAAGLTYTVARVAYGAIYIFVDHPVWSATRGITWWAGNGSCLYLLWRSWQKLNA